ncbi:MAG TPA: FtsX-like permease family protein [Candidatus Bathyarchaeia archaeon]|nr:FtsX-like permease family protein [Candidatus Bathyarchaeia archaeon]
MKTRDVFGYSFSAIKLRKLRAGLTILGVVIGIAAIVALLSITQGLQNTITLQLEKGLAADTLIVTSGRGFLGGGVGMGGGFGGGDSDFRLMINDTATINALSPDIETSVAVIQRSVQIKSADRLVTLNIVGVDFAQYAGIYSSTFVTDNGTISLNPENDTVVIGKLLNDPWKNGTLLFNVNDDVKIIWTNSTARPPKDETYTGHIAAVLKEIGGFNIGGPSDTGVYIPISQAQSFFGTEESDMIIVKLKNSDNATITAVSRAITRYFSYEVSVVSSSYVLGLLSSVFSIIELFLAGIAAISLLVAGIGIMNIMIVSLIERTREIGILKALGMKSRTVLLIFLGESVIIGLIGAVIGIALGWGLANIVAIVFSGGGPFQGIGGNQAATPIGNGGMTITPVLTPTVLIGALAFGIGVSVIFALYPAWRASKLKPVEALRYE